MVLQKLLAIITQLCFVSILSLVHVTAIRVVAQTPPTGPQPTPTAAPTSGQPTQTSTQSTPANVQSASAQPNAALAQPNPTPVAGPSAEELRQRIERARALAAAHQLGPAARELEYVRALSGGDAAFRDGTSVMLMGIYLEDGNYSRAQSLLEEAFQSRLQAKDGSIRSYYALAGQAVNGLRLHLGRYRNFGVGLDTSNLPPEAINDLDRMRVMLERMIAQAKDMTRESPKGNDGLALLEDVLGIRTTLARDDQDRERWQTEYAQAREVLAVSRMEIASLRGAPPFARPLPSPTPVQALTGVPAPPKPANVPQPSATASTITSAQPMFVGSLNSRASKRVVPTYPQTAKTAKVEGIVRVHVNVNELGEVQVIKSDGPLLLRQAAEDAARGWKFTPVVVEGKPVRMSGFIDFSFYR